MTCSVSAPHYLVRVLRLLPLIFPICFVAAAYAASIAVLYVAVILHIIILIAEWTLGRHLAEHTLSQTSTTDNVLSSTIFWLWPALHIVAFLAALTLIARTDATVRQIFSIGGVFGYSINVFSAAIAHELLHRHDRLQRRLAGFLFCIMLYPHFPTVHIINHHRQAGTEDDYQTPRKGTSIHFYLGRALVGSLRALLSNPISTPGLRALYVSAVGAVIFLAMLLWFSSLFLFIVVQGIFAFIVIETINYVQHYDAASTLADLDPGTRPPANQDINFVTRALLFNLSLHASHHANPSLEYHQLNSMVDAPTFRLGYWTSFWLVWIPPLWELVVTSSRKATT